MYSEDDTLANLRSAFNATPTTFQATLSNLSPGTNYYVRVKPFTFGGGTLSPATQARTEESAPEDIPPPIATAVGPTSLSMRILAPQKPNGIIIR